MSAPPYMKLYVADYLGDTHHLGVREHGAYFLLLMAMWRAGGSLPAADASLARLARCSAKEWDQVKAAVLPFFQRARGRLTHRRLAREMARYQEVSAQRAEAGRRGGAKKPSDSSGEAEANGKQRRSKSPHNQIQIQRDKTPAPSGQGGLIPGGPAVACLEGAPPVPPEDIERRRLVAAGLRELSAELARGARP